MKNKYLTIYLIITFGLCWGLASASMIFNDFFTKLFGETSFTNPIVMIALYSPSIAGLFVYWLMGGFEAIKNLFSKFIPRKKDLIWFPIIIGLFLIYVGSIHYGSIAVGFDVPEMTLTFKQMVIEVVKNLFEEAGILGGVLGWIGFLMPYLQKKYNSNIKAGVITGLIFGIYVLPGYVITSFELAAIFPLYVIQLMLFLIFISYMFNATNGNLLFYVLLFWLISSGARLELYYFNAQVQLLQIAFFAVSVVIMHFITKKRNIEQKLQVLPDYVGIGA
ncbi:hypothetical protein [Lysinibacillus sphaericus]|uniref:CPBP family intramembrane metalloprotease n=1 Tax=Lysinibacillus sphaericus TaxID=1421 RepID=A0AAJ4ZTM0_LYSSH|nr:hypothetical protein [Lysinibacillus sphaericus]MED4543332.1 hypothetical protein [Lysinibacillus sphaericus]GEC81912.1 hypothetical protein LSP03_16550 [Lysinibacillus sphaericus]SUV16229.1 Uncharacterised protein [Lysinibacillus sphaericus]